MARLWTVKTWRVSGTRPNVNPFTAPFCKFSGLKDRRKHLQTVYFPVLYRIYFNAMHFDENPFTCQYERRRRRKKKEKKKAEGFQISHYYWSCLNDITAVKGLIQKLFFFWGGGGGGGVLLFSIEITKKRCK